VVVFPGSGGAHIAQFVSEAEVVGVIWQFDGLASEGISPGISSVLVEIDCAVVAGELGSGVLNEVLFFVANLSILGDLDVSGGCL
jgi:hypothetical protein